MTTPGWDPTQQGTPAGANQGGPQPPVAQQGQPAQAAVPGQVGPAGQAGMPGQVGQPVAPGAGEAGAAVPQGYPMQPAGMPTEQPPAGYGQPPAGYGQPPYGAPVPPQQPQPPYGPGGPGGPVPPYGQPPYPPPPGARPKGGNKGLLIGVCSVLAAALVGGGVYLALAGNDDDSGSSSADSGGSGGTKTAQTVDTPTAAATHFLDALKAKDPSAAAKFACEEFKQDVLDVEFEDGVTFSYKILGTEKISDSMTNVKVNEKFEKDGTVQEQGDQILVVTKDPEGYRVCGEQQPELSGG